MVSWVKWHPSKIHVYLEAQKVILFGNRVFRGEICEDEIILVVGICKLVCLTGKQSCLVV